jgi:archaellum biogenesis protein FlaJ (TadC family)
VSGYFVRIVEIQGVTYFKCVLNLCLFAGNGSFKRMENLVHIAGCEGLNRLILAPVSMEAGLVALQIRLQGGRKVYCNYHYFVIIISIISIIIIIVSMSIRTLR